MELTRGRAIKGVLLLLVAAPCLALLVAWTGIINVAASAGHPEWVNFFLRLTWTRSVALYSGGELPPDDLEAENRIQLGSAHFQGGCAPCHGAPGSPVNPVFGHMLPPPPELGSRVGHWETGELYRIVRHGLQFAGMPSWSGGDRPDEVWSVVAFLLALPEMGEAEYTALASGNSRFETLSARQLADSGMARLARTACDRCHETADSEPVSDLVPRLAGQKQQYLARALKEYRDGLRPSGIMQPVAAELDDEQIDALAAHYADMQVESSLAPLPASPSGIPPDAQEDESAARLVYSGDRPARIPACIACHGESSRSDYPWLAGQNAAWIEQQLRLWRREGRRESAWGNIMGTVAANLSDEQIPALASWIAEQPAGPGASL